MIKKIFSIAVTCTMLFQMFSSSLEVKAETTKKESVGTTYYVSTLDGNDNNDGLSEDEAFYSLEKINDIVLKPGDKVLLEAGSVFTNGFLHIQGSGSEEALIEIDKYGEGSNPRIDTNGQGIWYQDFGKQLDSAGHKYKGYVSSSILLYDVEYISIKNLEITNNAPEIEAKYNYLHTMNRTGVAAVAQNKGIIDSIYLDGLNIHDVIGNVYDKHMNNGGIYFTVFKPKNESETGISRYNDIKIENCIVDNVNRWGIAVGYTAYWDKFLGGEISDEVIAKYGSTKVEIRNNYIKDPGGDAITTMYCDRPIIEYNVSDGAARQINTTDYSETGSGRVAAAVWPWKCKDAVFQYNEVFDTAVNQDGQAWDADSGDGTIYQYNYSHNNGGGAVMICAGEAVNTVFRYNISENDLAGVLNLPYHPKAEIYNNTFYIKEGVPFIRPGMTGGVAVVENNIIYNAGAEKEEDWTRGNSTVTYSNNLYYNYKNIPTDDTAAVIGDPKFVDGGSAPDAYTGITPSSDEKITHDLSAFDGYKLEDDSPAINAGKFIANNGGLDFFGNKVSGTPDIGAYESKVASLDLYSSVYEINSEDGSIAGIEKDVLVKDFLKDLSYDDAAILVIKDKNGKTLNDNDIVTVGSKVILSANSKTKEYTISANVDNSIKDSIYMVKEDTKTVYVPSLENNPTTIEEVLEGITVHSTATVKVFNGDVEVKDGKIENGMTLKVTAENGDENSYSIEVKNSYQWALDYTGKQGNVWFAQKKANGVYNNLTNYDGTYPMWNGNNYGGVGIDAPNHSAVPTEETHGLLIDTLGTSGREEGHSMVYRAPKSGTITLSVKDDEPYLRQAGNSGGKVKLSFTHNGEEISSYELTESFAKIDVETMEININKGDLIRVEAQNIDNPTKPSIHITPQIEYQDVEVADTEAPTAPTEVMAENITENTVDISWTASTDNVGVTGYEVYNGDTLIATVNDGTSVKVTGLTAATEYTLSVKAVDAAGNKSEAGTVTFKTTEIKEVDKTELGKVIEYAEEVKANGALEDVAPAVVKEFEEALENAKAVLVDKNATADEVKAASDRLIDVIHMLEFKIGDKEQLEKLAQIINALDESEYIPSTWSKLQAELKKANKVLADENAMEKEVKEAYNKLIKAYLDLRLIPDKSKLEELINKAEAIDTSKYTKKSVNALNKQLKKAKKALDNKEATQVEVDEASKGLELALDGLELVEGNNNNNNGNNGNNNNGNNGNNSGNNGNNSSNNGNGTTNNGNSDTAGKGKLPATGGTSTFALVGVATLLLGAGSVLRRRK